MEEGGEKGVRWVGERDEGWGEKGRGRVPSRLPKHDGVSKLTFKQPSKQLALGFNAAY